MRQPIIPSGLKEFPPIYISFELETCFPKGVLSSMDYERLSMYADDALTDYNNIVWNAIYPYKFISIEYHKSGDLRSRIINEVFAYADDHCIQRIYVTAALLISDNEKWLLHTRKVNTRAPIFLSITTKTMIAFRILSMISAKEWSIPKSFSHRK